MVEAVNRIGGSANLTEAEMRRVNATTTEALEKMQRMGMQAPAGMQALAKETEGAAKAGGVLGSTVNTLISQFAGLFAVGKLIAFERMILDAADAITKMSEQTGLSLEEVQRLQYVSEQTSVSIESLTTAVQILQERLADPSSGAADAFRKLKINMDDFNAADVYQRLGMLSSALKDIHDPAEQARLAFELWGRQSREILPALKEGIGELGAAAHVMADDVVKANESIGDSYADLWSRIKAGAGTMQGMLYLFLGHGDAADEAARDVDGLEAAMAAIPPVALRAGASLEKLALSECEAAQMERESNAAFAKDVAEREKAAATAEALALRRATAIEHVIDAAAGYHAFLGKLTDAENQHIQSALKSGAAEADIALALGVTETQVRANAEAIKDFSTVLEANKKILTDNRRP
jgi:hypothetical protein